MTIFEKYTSLIEQAEALKNAAPVGSYAEKQAFETIARMTKTRDSLPAYVANSEYVPLKGVKA